MTNVVVGQASAAAGEHDNAEPVVRLRHPIRWITSAIVIFIAIAVGTSLVTNERYQWNVVFQYFTSADILAGLWATLWLTAVAMVLGIVLGVVLAVMRISSTPALRWAATVYIWFFRGTPVFVQLLFWGYIAALYPTISFGVPFGEQFFGIGTNALITPVVAAILGLGLNEGAYMAEIVRAGIEAVPRGQFEAAQALGMRRGRVLRRIVMPQAMRVIVPPTANQVISMLKTTSLVSVLAFPELLYSAQLIYSQNFLTIPLLITACLWYLIVTTILTIGQFYVERHYGRGNRSATSAPQAKNGPITTTMRVIRKGNRA
ncbi:amino acid ABC transporter permease [Microbacterium esteraromaticum]|nr:amino acid ABC transporter permease [Microbacterium esteraromaticum]